jgi:hypothetical protein
MIASTLLLGGVLAGCGNADSPSQAGEAASASPSASTSVSASPEPTPTPTKAAITVSPQTTCAELITMGRGKGLLERSLDWVMKGNLVYEDSQRNYNIVQELNEVSARAEPQFHPYIGAMVDLMDRMRADLDKGVSSSYDLGDYRAAGTEIANMCLEAF